MRKQTNVIKLRNVFWLKRLSKKNRTRNTTQHKKVHLIGYICMQKRCTFFVLGCDSDTHYFENAPFCIQYFLERVFDIFYRN